MKFLNFQILGVAMLIVDTFAATMGEQERGATNEMQNAQGEVERRGGGILMPRGQLEVERRAADCEEPWIAVNGIPDKCYLYLNSGSMMDYESSNDLCTQWQPWSRLFTPMTRQEMQSVELALIPDTVRNTISGRYFTSFVGNASGTQQYSSNSFPFEMVNKDLWAKNEPNVGGPQCVLGKQPEKDDSRAGLCDVVCTNGYLGSGHSVICEVTRFN